MGRAMLILVADDQALVESCRTYAQVNGMNFQSHSNQEWANKNAATVPALATGAPLAREGAKILPFPGKPGMGIEGPVRTINELESEAIEKAIHEFNGNLTEAAKALGIGRATLYRKVKQYNIDPAAARRKRAA